MSREAHREKQSFEETQPVGINGNGKGATLD
jgi:hypothetical protein